MYMDCRKWDIDDGWMTPGRCFQVSGIHGDCGFKHDKSSDLLIPKQNTWVFKKTIWIE